MAASWQSAVLLNAGEVDQAGILDRGRASADGVNGASRAGGEDALLAPPPTTTGYDLRKAQ